MNAQQLEYIRIKLRQALVDDSGNTKGQLEAFAEHPPADKDRNPRKRIHVVELDNGHGGVVRRVKAENSALYVMETRSRRCPMPPIKDKAFSSCSWRRAILTLDTCQQAWIKYCYGNDLNFAYQTEICRYIWETYQLRMMGVRLQKKVKKRIIALVWLQVQVFTEEIKKSRTKEYSDSALSKLLGISRQTWSEVYNHRWYLLHTILNDLDRCALKNTIDEVEAKSSNR